MFQGLFTSFHYLQQTAASSHDDEAKPPFAGTKSLDEEHNGRYSAGGFWAGRPSWRLPCSKAAHGKETHGQHQQGRTDDLHGKVFSGSAQSVGILQDALLSSLVDPRP